MILKLLAMSKIIHLGLRKTISVFTKKQWHIVKRNFILEGKRPKRKRTYQRNNYKKRIIKDVATFLGN